MSPKSRVFVTGLVLMGVMVASVVCEPVRPEPAPVPPTATLIPMAERGISPFSICDVTVTPGAVNYDGSGLSPGDTVCLNVGDYSRLRFYDFTGTVTNPITITNSGGLVHMNQVTDTVDLDDCQYTRFTGAGYSGLTYGIKLVRRLRIRDHSRNVEIDHIEMYDDDVGLSIANSEDREDFWYFNIHDNYLHDITDEAMYIGTDNPVNGLKYVTVCTNTIDSVGEGIQVGWTAGYCRIHDNTITDINTELSGDPCYAAIATVDGVDDFDIYRNSIIDSDRRGISIQDGGGEVWNNLIVNTGHYTPSSAIRNFTSDVVMYNNTIITSTEYGIDCSAGETGNEGYNNVILATTDDSIDRGGSAEEDFHHNDTKEEGHTSVNYSFVDLAGDDYRLTVSSAGVDAGTDTGAPSDDLDGNVRPRGESTDIGCYEFQGLGIFRRRMEGY